MESSGGYRGARQSEPESEGPTRGSGHVFMHFRKSRIFRMKSLQSLTRVKPLSLLSSMAAEGSTELQIGVSCAFPVNDVQTGSTFDPTVTQNHFFLPIQAATCSRHRPATRGEDGRLRLKRNSEPEPLQDVIHQNRPSRTATAFLPVGRHL